MWQDINFVEFFLVTLTFFSFIGFVLFITMRQTESKEETIKKLVSNQVSESFDIIEWSGDQQKITIRTEDNKVKDVYFYYDSISRKFTIRAIVSGGGVVYPEKV